jgi:dienelactone hydrolase
MIFKFVKSTQTWFLCVSLLYGLTGCAQNRPAADSLHKSKVLQKYSTIDYLQRQISRSAPIYAVPDNPSVVAEWRKSAANCLRKIFGIDESEPVPLNPRVGKWIKRDGYRLQHVIFSAEENVDIPGWILVPDSAGKDNKVPAVLCIHGGVPGAKDEVVGELSNPAAARGYERYSDDYARQFVKQGFVTFAIDLRNYGERMEKFFPDHYGLNNAAKYNQVFAMNALFMGQTFFGLHLFDCGRALDYLMTRDEIDTHAVAAAGFSFGGNLAVWLSALDRRIKVVGMEGNCPSWRRTMTNDITRLPKVGAPFHLLPGINSQMIPGFFRYLDMNISLALAAPTDMIISNEYESWAFDNLEEAKRDAQPIIDVYKAFNASDNIQITYVTGRHQWHENIIVPWVSKKLRQIEHSK